MNKKDILLLSGASVLFCVPAVADTFEQPTPVQQPPAVEGSVRCLESACSLATSPEKFAVNQNVIPETTALIFAEAFANQLSKSLQTPNSEPNQFDKAADAPLNSLPPESSVANSVRATVGTTAQVPPEAVVTDVSENPTAAAPTAAPVDINSVSGQFDMQSTEATVQGNDEANSPTDSTNRVTSVSQLSDVQPTEWAFQALQSLVERYGVIAGYPDGTFRGNRVMTRYEFAASLNAALDKVNELIAAGTADKVSKEDLQTLRRLEEEFTQELAALRGRIDNLEARTAQVEANRFTSSTTVFGGEVILGLSTAFGGDPPGTGNANAVLTQLTRLQTVSTFNGKDRLRLELASGNFPGFGFGDPEVLNTFTALQSFQQDTGNGIELSSLEYRFAAFGDRAVFTFKPVGFSLSSVLTANSPYFDAGRGAISRFGEAPPVFKIGNLDAGVGVDFLLSNRLRLQLAYGASNAQYPSQGFVFGKDAHAAGLQLLYLPGNSVLTGLTFIYGYSPNGRLNTFTGSAIADASGFINQRSNIYAVNGTLQWRITPQFTIATWGGIVGTYAAATDAFAVSTNYLFSLGFSDPFRREGDLVAVLFGQPPKLIDVGGTSGSTGLADNASSFHIEAFYRFTVNDNISITPGFFVVTNPGNIENNNTIYIGTLRTTFRF